MRTVHDLQQGTPAWALHRRNHLNASDAAAMLGMSPYVTRSDLMRDAALGVDSEPSPEQAKRFADGHAYEAIARPWAEEIIGEELFPVVASLTVDGLPLSASVDGATMDEGTLWEHKSLNQALDTALGEGVIPPSYHPQMEQQLLILGAKRCLFMASDGERETMRHAWYESNPELRARIIAGWKQFEEDRKNFVYEPIPAKANAVPQPKLPVATITVKGKVDLKSNFVEYGKLLDAYIDGINTAPATDEEFATAIAQVSDLNEAREKLLLAEEVALQQFTSIDEMRSFVEKYAEVMRTTRLALEKAIDSQKLKIRETERQRGAEGYTRHLAGLQERLGPRIFLQHHVPAANWADAMKAKKTVKGLRDGVEHELTRLKLLANEVADRIEMNLKHLAATAPDHGFLFADLQAICNKASDDFVLLVKSRVDEHTRADALKKAVAEETERKRAEAVAASAGLVPAVLPKAANDPPQPPSTPAAAKGRRPTEHEVVNLLAREYGVSDGAAADWLLTLNREVLRELAAVAA